MRVVSDTNQQVGVVRPAASGATSLNVTGLVNGTRYRFLVQAKNATSPGAWSGSSNTVIPAMAAGGPVIGTASAGVAGGKIQATARWTRPVSTGGSNITCYVVTALRINAAGAAVWQTSSAVQPYNAGSLTMTLPAGNYRFFVRARTSVGLGAQSARSGLLVTAR